MTPRQQRIAELVTARRKLDAQIRRLAGYNTAHAETARQYVWSGLTHAETAATMGLPVEQVTRLIAWSAHERRPEHPAPTVARTDTIDEVAVQRAMNGGRVRLTLPERRLATARLAGQGLSDEQIAERLGVTRRTVLRDRKAHGIESRWVA